MRAVDEGSPLAHLRFGDGPRALILLHGFLGSARNLAALGGLLVAGDPRLTVWALDLPGHGASPPLPPAADLATTASAVLATARALGLPGPLAIVGHSLGGRVALSAGRVEPAALSEIVLLDISPGPFRPETSEMAGVVPALLAAPERGPTREAFRQPLRAAGLSETLCDWLLTNLGPEAGGYRWRIDRPALAAFIGRANAEDLGGGRGRPAVPCARDPGRPLPVPARRGHPPPRGGGLSGADPRRSRPPLARGAAARAGGSAPRHLPAIAARARPPSVRPRSSGGRPGWSPGPSDGGWPCSARV
jgi:pimeloyl-ACP methyl ester carboxylesterase